MRCYDCVCAIEWWRKHWRPWPPSLLHSHFHVRNGDDCDAVAVGLGVDDDNDGSGGGDGGDDDYLQDAMDNDSDYYC